MLAGSMQLTDRFFPQLYVKTILTYYLFIDPPQVDPCTIKVSSLKCSSVAYVSRPPRISYHCYWAMVKLFQFTIWISSNKKEDPK